MASGARNISGECPGPVQAAHEAMLGQLVEGVKALNGKMDQILEARVETAKREATVDGRLVALEKTTTALEGEGREERGRWAGLWPGVVASVVTSVLLMAVIGGLTYAVMKGAAG